MVAEFPYWPVSSDRGPVGQAASDNSDRMLFTEALDQFYGGEPDPRTLELLRSVLPPRNISS